MSLVVRKTIGPTKRYLLQLSKGKLHFRLGSYWIVPKNGETKFSLKQEIIFEKDAQSFIVYLEGKRNAAETWKATTSIQH